MRTIIHISDLHFGRADSIVLEPLIGAIDHLRPDLIAVSGDLTQRARPEQFRCARQFLDRLAYPRIVVPGNHDVPLYNVFARFSSPLRHYERYITPDLAPFFRDDEIAVLGINTARSFTLKGGRINAGQVAGARARFGEVPAEVLKIVVTHHPFDVPAKTHERELVGRAGMAMEALAQCGVDMLLSGHLHAGRVATTGARFAIEGHAALVIQAGTATSTRTRNEFNAFNVVRTGPDTAMIEQHLWNPGTRRYEPAGFERFRSNAGQWVRI
ncbi:MAG: metallophosphoesterase family protein [Betaproteobacteria bacterium]